MDTLYHIARWVKGLDDADLLLYVGMPVVLLFFLMGWLRDFLRPWK